jgi:ubiquitin carboxyl-terminal hydrolase 8
MDNNEDDKILTEEHPSINEESSDDEEEYEFEPSTLANKGKTGISNLGNTCYINSASQCLSHTTLLRDFFLSKQYEKYQKKNHKSSVLVDEWYDMLTRLWSVHTGVAPYGYVNNVRRISSENEGFSMFGGFGQNDSQEYLGFFIDQLHEVLSREVDISITGTPNNHSQRLLIQSYENWKRHFHNSYSIFTELFFGQTINIIDCPKTGEKSYRFEPQSTIALSIPSVTHDNKLTLNHCFQEFVRHSVLQGDNAWYSEKSKKKEKAYRSTYFWKLPKYMIVILKRFRYDGHKKTCAVEFPEELDMTPYTIMRLQPTKYKLYGVINHFGSSHGGHYTAYCRNHKQWREFDDLNVKDMNENFWGPNQYRSAYVLFYERDDE